MLKYFGTNNTKKTNEEEAEKEKEDFIQEDSAEPSTSSNADHQQNNLSDLVETMNAVDYLDGDIQPSTSKAAIDPSKSNSDESNLDADYNFENDDCIVVSESEQKSEPSKDSKQSNNTKPNYFQPTAAAAANIENLEETDYVQCKQCLKKILIWFMPGKLISF